MRFEIKISETSCEILFCTCLSLSLKKIVGVFAYIMEMHKIETNKKKYLELLLLADEQESMVDRYLERGDMFVLFSPTMAAIGVAVVTDEGNGVCELKNLAVHPDFQRCGYGRKMVEFLCNHYGCSYKEMMVGTGDSLQTVSFYKSCGFHYSHAIPDFFILNYDHLIVEDGKILRDMLYFRKEISIS